MIDERGMNLYLYPRIVERCNRYSNGRYNKEENNLTYYNYCKHSTIWAEEDIYYDIVKGINDNAQ